MAQWKFRKLKRNQLSVSYLCLDLEGENYLIFNEHRWILFWKKSSTVSLTSTCLINRTVGWINVHLRCCNAFSFVNEIANKTIRKDSSQKSFNCNHNANFARWGNLTVSITPTKALGKSMWKVFCQWKCHKLINPIKIVWQQSKLSTLTMS